MNLAPLLTQDAIIPQLDARAKKQALKMMAAHAAQHAPLTEREIFSVLQEREQIGCTGMGNGVCIPHGRFDNLKTVHIFFARLEKPVDFGAADGRPVDLLFLLLTPRSANTDHLKALASISRLLRDKKLCAELRKATTATELHALLITPREDDAA